MRTRGLVAGLGLAMGLWLPACSSCNGATSSAGPTGEAGSPVGSLTPEQASKVLARVGDKTITLGDYAAALEHMDQFDRLRYQSPERRKELLDEMINVMLLAQEASDKGYDKDPAAQQEVRSILRDAMLEAARKGAPAPNDIPTADVQAYYDAHRKDYSDPERRRLSLIALPDLATANQVLAQAKSATAAQWGELARAKSTDPAAHATDVPKEFVGDVGFVAPPGDARGDNPRVPPEVRAAAFEIANIGDVLPRAVKSGTKFYLVRLVQRSEPHERTMPEAERTIRVKLAQDAMRAKEKDVLDKLRAEFPVQIDDRALADVRLAAVSGPGFDGGPSDAGAASPTGAFDAAGD